MSILGNVHSFETFGTVDGPNTRFVIFLQGCPLRCQYCHNPDSWSLDIVNQYSVEDILKRYESIRGYVSGGITISGGEPLLQMEFVKALAKAAHKQSIHVALDTSGVTFNPNSQESVKEHLELLENIDLFLLDIKAVDPVLHQTVAGVPNENILAFAKFLSDHHQTMWIRHVVIPGLTYTDQNLWKLGEFIATLSNVEKIELLPFHQLGTSKYESLRIDYPLKGVAPLNKTQLARAEKIVQFAYQKTKEHLSS